MAYFGNRPFPGITNYDVIRDKIYDVIGVKIYDVIGVKISNLKMSLSRK